MPSYKLYRCPGCESCFRAIFPDPIPSYYSNLSKIKLKCLACAEEREPYAFLLDRIMQTPEPGIPSIEVLDISPPDPNPPPDVRRGWQQEIFMRRAARFRAMYEN